MVDSLEVAQAEIDRLNEHIGTLNEQIVRVRERNLKLRSRLDETGDCTLSRGDAHDATTPSIVAAPAAKAVRAGRPVPDPPPGTYDARCRDEVDPRPLDRLVGARRASRAARASGTCAPTRRRTS